MEPLELEYDTLEKVDPAYHSMYTERGGKFVFTGVKGIKTQKDVDTVMGSLTKERKDHKAVKDILQLYGDLKPEEVRAQLDRIPELEVAAAGKVDNAAIEKIVETRLASKVAPHLQTIKKLETDNLTQKQQLEAYAQADTRRAIRGAISAATAESKGFVPSAVEDAADLGERIFEVNADKSVTTKSDIEGVTPGLSPKEWLNEIQSKKVHWWGPSEGGNANGGKGAQFQGANNPFTAEAWNVTKQNELVRTNRATADAMAKAAGTTIGGLKPPVKK